MRSTVALVSRVQPDRPWPRWSHSTSRARPRSASTCGSNSPSRAVNPWVRTTVSGARLGRRRTRRAAARRRRCGRCGSRAVRGPAVRGGGRGPPGHPRPGRGLGDQPAGGVHLAGDRGEHAVGVDLGVVGGPVGADVVLQPAQRAAEDGDLLEVGRRLPAAGGDHRLGHRVGRALQLHDHRPPGGGPGADRRRLGQPALQLGLQLGQRPVVAPPGPPPLGRGAGERRVDEGLQRAGGRESARRPGAPARSAARAGSRGPARWRSRSACPPAGPRPARRRLGRARSSSRMTSGVWKTENSPKFAARAHGSSAAAAAMATSSQRVVRQERQQQRAQQHAEQRADAPLDRPGEHRAEVGLEHDRHGEQHPVGAFQRRELADQLADGHAQRQAQGERPGVAGCPACGRPGRAAGRAARPAPRRRTRRCAPRGSRARSTAAGCRAAPPGATTARRPGSGAARRGAPAPR